MKKNKVILAVTILFLVFLVGGAIAFFTDTKSKTNTFTIGNVEITLTEPNWSETDSNSNGVPDAAENLMPGDSVAKDPTITNVGSNDAYVFAKVVMPCTTDTTPEEIFTYTTNSGWYLMNNGTCSSGSATKIYAYGTSSSMTTLPPTSGSNSTAALFSSVSINSTIDGSESNLTGNQDVVVTGYAIQTTGLTDTTPSSIWTEANFN